MKEGLTTSPAHPERRKFTRLLQTRRAGLAPILGPKFWFSAQNFGPLLGNNPPSHSPTVHVHPVYPRRDTLMRTAGHSHTARDIIVAHTKTDDLSGFSLLTDSS